MSWRLVSAWLVIQQLLNQTNSSNSTWFIQITYKSSFLEERKAWLECNHLKPIDLFQKKKWEKKNFLQIFHSVLTVECHKLETIEITEKFSSSYISEVIMMCPWHSPSILTWAKCLKQSKITFICINIKLGRTQR